MFVSVQKVPPQWEEQETLSMPPRLNVVQTPTEKLESQYEQQVTEIRVLRRESFTLNGKPYRAVPPLCFLLTQHSGMFHLQGDFDICLTHESPEELTTVLLLEVLEYLWEEYALENDSDMDEGARKLRAELLNRFAAQPRG